MVLCKDCRHWSPDDLGKWYARFSSWHACEKMTEQPEPSEQPLKEGEEYPSKVMALGYDTGYGWAITAPDFGCVQGVAKHDPTTD